MNAIWTVDGDETSWSSWADNIAFAPASSFMLGLIENNKAIHPGWALDIGCGTGRAFLPLVEAGYQVIGLDPIMNSLRYSQQRMGKTKNGAYPIQASAVHIPIPDKAISFILAISSLFHLGFVELKAALREVHRVLHPDGKAILHFLDLEDWRRTLAKEISPERAPIPSYRFVVTCFCTHEKIQEWINQAGLQIITMELKTNQSDSGQQRNWLAYCGK
jgi:ubiquinone/menaquinone biosynthesis C-methylase UbiE